MGSFVAKPIFNITIKSKSKMKKTYQYREGNSGKWIDISGNFLFGVLLTILIVLKSVP